MPPRRVRTERVGCTDRRTFLKSGAVLASWVLATGAASAGEHSEIHEGESADVGDGTVTAYATTNSGEFSSLGVHVDGDALASVDDDGEEPHEEVATHLSFPDEVDTRQFTFMGFHFNPMGHPPPEVYTVPHFDFHFYMIEEEVVEGVPMGVAAYDLPDEQHPPEYAFEDPRFIEPEMGEHLLDGTAPEFGDGEFTHTYVYGAYDPAIDPEEPDGAMEMELGGETQEVPVFEGDGEGRLHFVEPMVTTEFFAGLDEEISADVATPESFFTEDQYPTEYVLRPDRSDGVRVEVTGFERFPGSNG